MNLLDLILAVVLLGYAMSGYWQGFLVGATSTVGLLGGGLLAIVLAPVVLDGFEDSVGLSLAALAGVLLLASLGQVLGGFLGSWVRSYVTWSPARVVDAVGGAALSLVASLLVIWVLGYVISGARIPWLGPQVRSSAVLSTVDDVMPDAVTGVLGSFDELVGSDLFPRFLEPFVPERIIPVAPPDSAVRRTSGSRSTALSGGATGTICSGTKGSRNRGNRSDPTSSSKLPSAPVTASGITPSTVDRTAEPRTWLPSHGMRAPLMTYPSTQITSSDATSDSAAPPTASTTRAGLQVT